MISIGVSSGLAGPGCGCGIGSGVGRGSGVGAVIDSSRDFRRSHLHDPRHDFLPPRGMLLHSLRRFTAAATILLLGTTAVHAQQIDPRMYSEMRWRMIGPHRASRTKAAVGIPDQPNVFYIGVVNGGVWKTTD